MVIDNITAAIIGAVGGFSGGLCSGAYQHFRDRLTRPQLRIDYEGKEGANQVTVSDSIYIRARVKNNGHQIARSCRVFWTDLREVHPSGATTEASFHDSMTLAWAGRNFIPLDVPGNIGPLLVQGTNWLYIDAVNLGGPSGLIFSANFSTPDAVPEPRTLLLVYHWFDRSLRYPP